MKNQNKKYTTLLKNFPPIDNSLPFEYTNLNQVSYIIGSKLIVTSGLILVKKFKVENKFVTVIIYFDYISAQITMYNYNEQFGSQSLKNFILDGLKGNLFATVVGDSKQIPLVETTNDFKIINIPKNLNREWIRSELATYSVMIVPYL